MMAKRGHQAGLGDFGDGGFPEPPLVILDTTAETVRPPTDRSKVAGHIGTDRNREGNSFVARKVRRKHYYHRGEGYAVSKKILDYLKRNYVKTLYFHEADSKTCYEFAIDQYRKDGDRVRFAPQGDPQVCVPLTDARHVWFDRGDPSIDQRGRA